MNRFRLLLIASVVFFGVFGSATVEANEPGWSWRVVTFGDQRQQIESTPILERSYRPLHVYGNTVRRRHYRGNATPARRSR